MFWDCQGYLSYFVCSITLVQESTGTIWSSEMLPSFCVRTVPRGAESVESRDRSQHQHSPSQCRQEWCEHHWGEGGCGTGQGKDHEHLEGHGTVLLLFLQTISIALFTMLFLSIHLYTLALDQEFPNCGAQGHFRWYVTVSIQPVKNSWKTDKNTNFKTSWDARNQFS